MAFGIGINARRPQEGPVKGIQMEIACECWFTRKGKACPVMLKFQDEEGEIHTIREIQVHSQEEKNYAGIPSIEYRVTVTYQGISRPVKLLFFKEECRWVMNFAEG